MGGCADGHAFSFGIADGKPVLFAHGELDADAAAGLLERLDPMRSRHLYLDLGAITFMDVSILCVLLTLHRRQESAGGSMTLRNVQPSHLRLFEVTRLAATLRIEITLPSYVHA